MAGPFYFAWVNQTDTTFGPTFVREDESVYSFSVEQTEGDFAALTIEIKNPKVGLLTATRKTWCWLSWDNGSSVVPLFFGRLVAVPDSILGEFVTLIFTARPVDFVAQKTALAAALRVTPYWDPVFVDPGRRDDPDAVLEARSELWAIDRVTHTVSVSDLLSGEDGLEEFLDNEVPYDSVSITIGQPPLRSISVDGVVNWTQAHNSSGGGLMMFQDKAFECPTKGLAEAWPKVGASIGGGWFVTKSDTHTSVDGIKEISASGSAESSSDDGPDFSEFPTGASTSSSVSWSSEEPFPYPKPSIRVHTGLMTKMETSPDGNSGSSSVSEQGYVLAYPLTVWGTLWIGYEASRDRTEHVRFTMQTNVQAIVTLPGDEEIEILNVSGVDVGVALSNTDHTIPIGNVARRSYFATPRGNISIQYLLMLARAHLMLRSRCVEISWDCHFARAIELSCRKSAMLHDNRIPGGSANGKITGYSFSANGDTGVVIGHVTIGCSIGYGGSISISVGPPLYVNEGYVAADYQAYEEELIPVGAGDVGYTRPVDNGRGDDGLQFPLRYIPFVSRPVVSFSPTPEIHYYSAVDFQPLLQGAWDKDSVISKAFDEIESRLDFTLKPVSDSTFETGYDLVLTLLELPQGIDLEASSS